MGIRLILIWTLSLASCGSDGTSNSSGDETPCSTVEGKLTLHVASSVPAGLSSACAQGRSLEAFLLVPGRDSCPLEIKENRVSGCCGDVASGQNPYVDLYFREGETLQALGTQSKVVYLPVDSGPIVDLNFDGTPFDGSSYDSDNDGTLNAEEYCNGTL